MKQPILILLISITAAVSACMPGSSSPTPTIVPLDRTALAQRQQTPTADDPPPTATRIPLASPILTPTSPAEAPAVMSADMTPTPASSPTIEAAVQAEIVTVGLNVRQGPGMAYGVVGTAQQGDRFDVLGIDRFGDWLQISFDGQPAWISAQPRYAQLRNGSLADLTVIQAATPASPPTSTSNTAFNAVSSTNPVEPEPARRAANGLSGRLVLTTDSGGALYTVNVDGSNLRRLAEGVIDPAVSPDGQQVAFTRWDSAEFGALFTVDLESGRERTIVGDIRQPKSPTWSPDGERIVISFQHGGVRDPKKECRTYDFGEDIRIPERATITWFKVRDNGTIGICFIRKEDLRWYLREIEVNSGEFKDLPSGQYAYSPTWDPQNPWRVVYSGETGLVQFDLNSGEQRPFTEDVRDTEPRFSPDGQRLAITYKQHDHWEVYTIDPATGERRRLTKPPILADPQYNSAAPAWSPDGAHLAFMTDRRGPWEIWVMTAEGSNPRPLLPPEVQAQLDIQYRGVNERLLNWID